VARLDGFYPQGDGQVGLAHPGRAEQDDVLAALHEAQPAELPDHLAVDARLEGEVELLDGLHPREAGNLLTGFDHLEVPAVPLRLQGIEEELPIALVLLGGLFAERVDLVAQVLHLHLLEEVDQLHKPTSSYTERSRRCTWKVCCQSA